MPSIYAFSKYFSKYANHLPEIGFNPILSYIVINT
jgi:hypothetical protein